MSDIREVHAAVRNDLQRRRELNAMTKPDLITHVIRLEHLIAAKGEQP